MSIDDLVRKRFGELEVQMYSLPAHPFEQVGLVYDIAPWRQWATSVQNILLAALGEGSVHYRNFKDAYANSGNFDHHIDVLKGIFLAAKADYEGGYVFSLQAQISGEIFGDFVTLAKGALSEEAKDVAAVLACAALEDALKRFASMNGLDVSDKGMQDIVNTLKAKGLVQGAQKGLLDAMPKIRNYAMHANWEKITKEQVGSVIGFVEQFLLKHFSP